MKKIVDNVASGHNAQHTNVNGAHYTNVNGTQHTNENGAHDPGENGTHDTNRNGTHISMRRKNGLQDEIQKNLENCIEFLQNAVRFFKCVYLVYKFYFL